MIAHDAGGQIVAAPAGKLLPILVLVAVVTYGCGFHAIPVGADDEACAKGIIHERADFVRLDEGFPPPHSTCVFEDGETYEGSSNLARHGEDDGNAACATGS